MNNSLMASDKTRLFQRQDLVALVALVLVNLVWVAAIPASFLPMDDAAYILDNPYVSGGLSWASVKWAFTTTHGAFWFPLLWLSLALDTTIFGMHAWGYHLTNVVIHVANTLLIYWLFRRLLALAGWPNEWRKCLLAAAIFAVHPQRVESIAWAVERKDVLAAFFGLLAIFAYLHYARRPSFARYFVVALVLLMSLMSKPMLVTIPPLLLVLDYWPLGRMEKGRVWGLVKEKLPLLLFGMAISCNTYLIQVCAGSIVDPAGGRLRNCIMTYFLYVRDFFYVGHLTVVYGPMPWVRPWHIAGALAFLVGVTALGVMLVRRGHPAGKPLLVGWLWFAGVVFPMSGFVQSGYNIRADRFSYFPMIGLMLALVWGIVPLLRLDRMRWVSVAGGVAVVGMFGWLSLQRIALWQDPLVLLEHDARWEPDNYYLNFVAGLSAEYHIESDPPGEYLHDPAGLAAKNHALRERALAHFRRTEEIEPRMRPLSEKAEKELDQLIAKSEAARAAAAGEVASAPATMIAPAATRAVILR